MKQNQMGDTVGMVRGELGQGSEDVGLNLIDSEVQTPAEDQNLSLSKRERSESQAETQVSEISEHDLSNSKDSEVATLTESTTTSVGDRESQGGDRKIY